MAGINWDIIFFLSFFLSYMYVCMYIHVHVLYVLYVYAHVQGCYSYMHMKTPIWSTLHHPKGTTQKGTTRG